MQLPHSGNPLFSVNFPSAHSEQNPLVLPKKPTSQKPHDFEPVEAVVSPISHCLQDVGGSNSARFHPCGHSKQSLLPFVETNLPAAHI